MNSKDIIYELKKYANAKNVEGMARFGICGKNVLGGPNIPTLRVMAKDIKNSTEDRHMLAQELWESGIHEAKLLAGFIDDANKLTEVQMEKWVADFDSWDICDQVCSTLFDKNKLAWVKALEWTKRKQEYVKRAGFVLMATLAVHDKTAKDEDFIAFFEIIKREVDDKRNYVKKAINWALRQIGKRNDNLRIMAIKTGGEILDYGNKHASKSARWIANDALRELKLKDR